MPTIACLTPHIPLPDREEFFQQSMESVLTQTRPPDQYIVESDPTFTGCAATLNRCLPRVTSEFVCVVADDDYLLPDHLERLEFHVHDRVDVLYPDFLQIGAQHYIGGPFDEHRLRRANYIPGVGALVRTAAIRAVGGWCRKTDSDWHQYEDWVMWLRLLNSGYRFEHVPLTTWAYRFGPQQTTAARAAGVIA